MQRREFLRSTAGAALSVGAASTWATVCRADSDEPPPRAAARGPLRGHEANPRYFADDRGRPVYLAGAHTWSNLPDIGPGDPPRAFDFDSYVDWLTRLNHNFIRLWRWEALTWNTGGNAPNVRKQRVHRVAPHPWSRSGGGKAIDGMPRFDLDSFNDDYFRRLRRRVQTLGRRGIYAAVMLFEGWAMQHSPGAWKHHPFHPRNNANDVGDVLARENSGLGAYALRSKAATRVQEAYVRKVVDTLNDLDNVLYEICNEAGGYSTAWQYHMIEHLREHQSRKPHQHPIGMTYQYSGGSNRTLFDSAADWVSPNPEGGYRDDPPVADGRKVIVSDTDHLWGIGGSEDWVWKSFLRGHNPLFMDTYDGVCLGTRFDERFDPIRRSLGQSRRLAARMNLGEATPSRTLASSGYCLANASPRNAEYLAYLPAGRSLSIDLSASPGPLSVEWFHPESNKFHKDADIRGGARRMFTAPSDGPALLYLATTSATR